MYNYYTSTKSSRLVPLTYVIHKIPPPSIIVIDREKQIIQNYPLQVNIFYCNTKKVLVIVKELTVDNDAETWINGKRCG